MMETEQTAGSCPSPGQAAVRTWLPSNTRGGSVAPSEFASRFHRDGVRYKAKLIGVDPVSDAQGDKMCWDSMMKLKGLEEAARRQGRHKRRIWLKIVSTGLKIMDERTGAVLYEQERSKISSLTKDVSDPRALAYVYQYQDAYILFYIRMANLADPVLVDIYDMCQNKGQETLQVPGPEQPQQNLSLLPLNDTSGSADEGAAPEEVFSPRPESLPEQANQISSHNELMQVFAIPLEEPLTPCQTVNTSPEPPQQEQHKPMLSTTQILSMFPTPAVGGPPRSPSAMPWGQQAPLGNQWAGPAVAPWPTMPGSMSAWAPPGTTAPPAGGHSQAPGVVGPQPGGMMGGGAVSSPVSPSAFDLPSMPLNSCTPPGSAGATQTSMLSLDNLL